jgi:hypothetical protein
VDRWIILLVLVISAVAWFLARPPAVFVVRIKSRQPLATQGRVTASFLAILAELCQQHSLDSGEVRGVARGRRISLWFSGGVPSGFRQQLRNWWARSGWQAPPRRR